MNMEKQNMFKLQNFESLTQYVAQIKDDTPLLKTLLYDLLNYYPFCFAYFKQLLNMLDLEEALELITLQLKRSPTSNTWQVYLEFAKKHPDVFDNDTMLLLYQTALQIKDPHQFNILKEYLTILPDHQRQSIIQNYSYILDVNSLCDQFNLPRLLIPDSKLLQLESMVHKRQFFHFKPLKPEQEAAFKELIQIYAFENEQLQRIFEITFQNSALRAQCLGKLVKNRFFESWVLKCFEVVDKSDVEEMYLEMIKWMSEKCGEDEIDTCNEENKEVNNECNNENKEVNSERNKEMKEMQKCNWGIIKKINSTEALIDLVHFFNNNQMDLSLIKPLIKEKITYLTQSEAKLLSYICDSQEILQEIKLFNFKNCDYLVKKLLINGFRDYEAFKDTDYAVIVEKWIRNEM